MAVSNALGSNVFDMNLGLGLPFMVNSIVTGKPVRLLNYVQEVSGEIVIYVINCYSLFCSSKS